MRSRDSKAEGQKRDATSDPHFLVDTLVRNAPVGIALVDLDHRFVEINATLAAINGKSREAHIGVHVADIVPTLWPKLEPIYRQVLATGQRISAVSISGILPADSAELREWQTDFYPVRDGDGSVIGIGIIASEITDLRRAEAESGRLLEHQRAMLAAMPDLIFELDEAGVHLSYHAPHVDTLFAPPDEFIGKRVGEVLPGAVAEKYEERIARTLSTGEVQVFDYRLDYPDGSRRVFDARMVRERADTVLVVVRDVTAQRQLEEQLLQARKMDAIGRLAGGVAHDFNNLLTVINGYTAMVMDQVTDADSRELLGEVAKAGQMAAGLTRQLLMFSRQQVVEPQVISLNKVVGETQRLLNRLIGEDIELATDLDASLRTIRIDSGQIEQVLVNLCVNARDAMTPGGGRLTIGTSNRVVPRDLRPESAPHHEGSYVVLTVADTGTGMDETVRARLFEPFFTTKDGSGTGLGLAVVFGVVKQNGGFIEVDTTLGEGTLLRLFFPAVGEQESDRVVATESQAMPRGNETILLVEDDPSVRTMAARILRQCGYSILEAVDGRDALSVLERLNGPFDLLLTDVVMPHLSGRELAETVRHIRPEVPVLFMSGYTDDDILRRGVMGAEVAFLQKPFTASAMALKVREVLDTRR